MNRLHGASYSYKRSPFPEHVLAPMGEKNGILFSQLQITRNALPIISLINIQPLYLSPNSQRFIHSIELQSHPSFQLLCEENDNI